MHKERKYYDLSYKRSHQTLLTALSSAIPPSITIITIMQVYYGVPPTKKNLAGCGAIFGVVGKK